MPLTRGCVDKEENSRHLSPYLRLRPICRHIFSSDLDTCPATGPALCRGFPPCCAELHLSGAAQSSGTSPGCSAHLMLLWEGDGQEIMYMVGWGG